MEDACHDVQIEKAALAEIQKHCSKCRLEKFEIPQALKLVPEVWTPDMVVVYSYELCFNILTSFLILGACNSCIQT